MKLKDKELFEFQSILDVSEITVLIWLLADIDLN